MKITTLIAVYAVSAAAFLLIDMIWLAVLARDFYRTHLGYIMSGNVNWIAAVLFYCIYIGGLLFFTILPSAEQQSLAWAAVRGAAFGLVAYATYDLTNYATLRDWPFIVVIADLAWGTFISSAVSLAGCYAAMRMS